MSEHVDMERSEVALFLLECDKRRDPWEKAVSCFGEGFRRGALPHGSGGREHVGELENTCVQWVLSLRLLCAGMGIQGDVDGTMVGDELEEHPLGTNMQWETSSSEHESAADEEESNKTEKLYCKKCRVGCDIDTVSGKTLRDP